MTELTKKAQEVAAAAAKALNEAQTELEVRLASVNPELGKFATALGKAAKETILARAEIAAINKSMSLFRDLAKEAAFAQETLQNSQVEFAKTMGADYAAAMDRATTAFTNANNEFAKFGVTQKEAFSAFKQLLPALKFTPAAVGVKNLKDLEIRLARNAKVIEDSKLIDFTKNVSLGTQMATKDAMLFGEQLVETAFKMGLPRDTLLNLNQDLLRTGITIGQTQDRIEGLTLRTEAFGRALGTTGKAISAQLGSMMTIGQRQQLAARLSQIGTMVGATVDVAKLMSADPAQQEEALQETLSSFSAQYQMLQSPAQKQALFLALSRSLKLPAEAVRNALESGVNIKDALSAAEKARADSQKGISDTTRNAVKTLNDTIKALNDRLKIEAGQEQLKLLNKALNKITGNSDKTATAVENFDKNMTKFFEKFEFKKGQEGEAGILLASILAGSAIKDKLKSGIK